MSHESELRRHRDAANRIRVDISKASSTVAAKRKKAADAQVGAARSKSPSTIRMKITEAERATKDANDAEKKRADLERKLADTEVKITKAQQEYEKERSTAQSKALADLRRTSLHSSERFAPGRFSDTYGERSPSTPSSPSPAHTSPVNDVFLSHASEDKDDIARPLKDALEALGVTVWFDELKIKVVKASAKRSKLGSPGAGSVSSSSRRTSSPSNGPKPNSMPSSARRWTLDRTLSCRSGTTSPRTRSSTTPRCWPGCWL